MSRINKGPQAPLLQFYPEDKVWYLRDPRQPMSKEGPYMVSKVDQDTIKPATYSLCKEDDPTAIQMSGVKENHL